MLTLAQSIKRLATDWTVRGSNPGEGEIFRTCPDRPWGPPSLLYNGYRVFPGGKKRQNFIQPPCPPIHIPATFQISTDAPLVNIILNCM